MQGNTQPTNTHQPWNQRDDWQQGYAKDQLEASSRSVLWFFAFFFNLIGVPLGFILPTELSERGITAFWLAYIPPALSLSLFLYALMRTFRGNRHKTNFEFKTMPGVIGGILRGTVRTDVPLESVTEIRYRLDCIEIFPEYKVSTTTQKSQTSAGTIFDRTPKYNGIRVEKGLGGTRFVFGPARMPGVALIYTAITLVLCGVTIGLYLKDVSFYA